MNDVAIFSVFGRGHSAARQAAQKGLQTCLVDVSKFLGTGWWAEDIEGPNGASLVGADSFGAKLDKGVPHDGGAQDGGGQYGGDYVDKAAEGLCCWPPQGPLLFEQSETLYKLKQLACSPEAVEYLQAGTVRRAELKPKLQKQKFDHIWLVYLSHHLGSRVYRPSVECLASPQPLNFFQPFYVRRSTHRGRQQELAGLQGVQVSVEKPQRVHITKGLVRGVECDGGALVGAKKYIWTLSSEETHFLSPDLAQSLFSSVLQPQWQWMRYRVSIGGAAGVQQLPLSTVMVNDIYASWTHANLAWLQRASQDGVFDVWLLLPYHARFDKSYLSTMFKQLKRCIENRVPGGRVKLQLGPVELRYAYEQLGPARWPVWAPHKMQTLKAKNLHVAPPEIEVAPH